MVAIEKERATETELCLPKEVQKILHSLASHGEDAIDEKKLQVVRLKGAMTNEVFQCLWVSKEVVHRKVPVRMYGEGVDAFFDREDEIRTFECMSKHGQGPRLLGHFPNGRIEEFIHARTLSAADLRDPEISAIIAAKLREFHDLDMPGPKDPFLWNRLRNWLIVATKLCSTEEAAEFELSKIGEEINILEKEVSNDDQKIGFCHNDLQYGNIMMDEETKALTIIDYEYATFNPVAYDIANHFCEMAADYHTETPQLLDFNKYPDYEERKRFVYTYLTSSGDYADEMKVERFINEAEKYALASHLLWALWGIISVMQL
ncbi:unnamed protein product [Victoria cruziana]